MCGFNYRFVRPSGSRARCSSRATSATSAASAASYLQSWLADASAPMVWRLDRERAGSGALGDIGAHVIDLARYLVGEIAGVAGG